MLSLYFAGWALGRPAWRWGGLALGLGRGLGFPQSAYCNAHFLSQTVWSAALLWFLGAVVFYPLIAGRGRLVGLRAGGMPAWPTGAKSGHLGGRPDRHRMISGTV